MPTLQEVKKRIRSVQNIAQITRALEAVSASRVRRAQARVLASRAFSEKAWEILLNIQQTAHKGAPLHPLLTAREEVNRVMVVLITADRGLAGAYNTNILRVAEQFATRLGKPVSYVAVGRKGRDSLLRMGADIVAEFSDLPPEPTIADISPIARLAIDAFLSGEADEVLVAYTDFISMLVQRPAVLGWLPLTTDTVADQVAGDYVKHVGDVSDVSDYEYEPGVAAVLDEIVPRFTELQLYQALLEAQASEHAARMTAMRNASDNASQLTSDLTLEYNKARQAAITSEILDIVGGANALQQTIDKLADEILARAVAQQQQAPQIAPVPAATNGGGRADDLTRIEGIGRKMAAALAAAGISTYRQLAAATTEELEAALKAAGMRFAPSLPTWAEQAAYAAKGDWEGLQELQGRLVAGRKQ